MNESVTLCVQCGGVTCIHSNTVMPDVIVDDSGNGPEVRVGNVTYKACMGHPTPKHDGWLNKQKDYNIDYGESWDKGIVIADYSDHYGETRYLRMPAQEALSLLTWLKQEEATLLKLAMQGEA